MWMGIVLYHWCCNNIIWIVGVVTVKGSTAGADGSGLKVVTGRSLVQVEMVIVDLIKCLEESEMNKEARIALVENRLTNLQGSPKNIKCPGVARKVARQLRNLKKD